MEMYNEEWIKSKYDQLTSDVRKNYVFISFKIKHFRKINRRYGRAYGDVLIKEVYRIIQDLLQIGDYAAHIYHGYYNLLLQIPEGPRDDHTLLLWITEFSKNIYYINDPKLYKDLFGAYGMYVLDEEKVDFYIAQYNADICRSESKERDYIISHVEMYGTSYMEQGLLAPNYRLMLEQAIKAGHIHMYLQPKVDMKTGRITHAEALMRWIDPELGMLPIQEYMPILEECGLANQVDMYMFETACKWIQKWNKQYHQDISISVNISKNTFAYPFFVEEIIDVFEKYDHCPKACIELELLESIILNQIEEVKVIAHKIHDYGFQCSLDDFGSGYSSYQVIAQAPLTMMKIDRSIFHDETSLKEQCLVRHLIETAHDLGLQVVAEGIETQGYAQYLKQLDCEYIQGYVYYRPMPIEEFEQRFILEKEIADINPVY